MTDGRRHAADLAIFTLDEFEREPRVGNVFPKTNRRVARGEGRRGIEQVGATGERAVIVDGEAAAREAGERGGGGDALDLRPIFPAMSVLRIEQAGVETGFVAQQQEALGVGVEATEGVNVFR